MYQRVFALVPVVGLEPTLLCKKSLSYNRFLNVFCILICIRIILINFLKKHR